MHSGMPMIEKKITKSVLKCSELVNNNEKLRNYFGEKRLH